MSTWPIAEFPDVEAKLQKPTKQSAFERQKAEAEAKRRRDAEETAAALEEFRRDHEESGNYDNGFASYRSQQALPRHLSGPSERLPFAGQPPLGGGSGKRHFGAPSGTPIKTGPGSLGPAPTSYGKKRPYDNFSSNHQRGLHEARGRLGFEKRESGALPVSKVFDDASDEEDTPVTADRAEVKAISKPTLRLANLPPGTSQSVIKALIPPSLTVENVKIIPPSGPSGTERKSLTAIVTLSKETPATEMDTAVSGLQNHYLGYGYFLFVDKHLSTAAMASALPTILSSTTTSQPFGAKEVKDLQRGPSGYGRGGGGFAPPKSYDRPMNNLDGNTSRFYVPVNPPRDIRLLRMIHMVIESVKNHGVEFEALLMSSPDVQTDERWAWIWDARSEGGVYYRWKLWEVMTGSERSQKGKNKKVVLFEGGNHPYWKAPDEPLAYEYATGVDEFVSDSDYVSEEEDAFEENMAGVNEQEDTFLSPMDKAKLTYLLARLPTTLSKIRKGDIARVTAFAIIHASRGASEIVEMVLQNIESPFAFTSANPDYKQSTRGRDDHNDDLRDASPTADDKTTADTPDTSAASLIGLYVVSDILASAGATGGIRHAWRYKGLVGTALKNRKTFELLGTIPDRLNWGRLKADKWKRSVKLVLSLWEGWGAFLGEAYKELVNSFDNPPVAKKDTIDIDQQKKAGRWKTIEGPASSHFLPVSDKPADQAESVVDADDDDDKAPEASDLEGELAYPKLYYSYDGDELPADLDGEPEDVGVLGYSDPDTAMRNTDDTSETKIPLTDVKQPEVQSVGGFRISANNAAPSRKRMRAVDMFADSGSDGDN
ncbi:hypothetical protein B0H66DRAFT_576264 [Apodospora peruviana]|uniref:CID domain-containing protein n=1 Tax=Apodospora peruviana TaxID=516989 RepID=A0AAE0I0M8_9PEZI|nr:hypothetical protein B0H66DRAFT_576264 [Apodospora peruviana]